MLIESQSEVRQYFGRIAHFSIQLTLYHSTRKPNSGRNLDTTPPFCKLTASMQVSLFALVSFRSIWDLAHSVNPLLHLWEGALKLLRCTYTPKTMVIYLLKMMVWSTIHFTFSYMRHMARIRWSGPTFKLDHLLNVSFSSGTFFSEVHAGRWALPL